MSKTYRQTAKPDRRKVRRQRIAEKSQFVANVFTR